MAPGTRSSKDVHSSKVSNNISKSVENQRSNGTVEDIKPLTAAEGKENNTTGKPLGPPPRPSQQNNDGSDYFNSVHNTNNNPTYQSEPNPFEAQFGNPSTETPGKLLPSVASLTSPSSLLPNETPGWSSLRSGPLSPAMLTGPAGGDYFDSSYARSFPTPNESGLRTGLTPGGGGSMFPAPSPNSQAIFNGLQLGAPTPNTMDFLRTGLNASRAVNGNAPTSQPNDQNNQGMDLKLPKPQGATDKYAQHDADAANGLFMLAQSNGSRTANQFAPTSLSGAVQPPPAMDPNLPQTRSQKNSLSTTVQADDSDDSDDSEEAVKPATRSRGKRQSDSKPNNRRKASETPAKTPASKRQKNNIYDRLESSPTPEEEEEMITKDGKKMTDEEKRKNFLERNRVAALKCRQRKKQWLQNLQNKVDIYSQENDGLTQTVAALREQNLQLRQFLAQHKDCPISAQQGFNAQTFMNMLHQDSFPYMQAPNGVSQPMSMMMAGQGPTAAPVIPRS